MPRTAHVALESGETVCERCLVADRPHLRLRGLIGRPPLRRGEGLLLTPCNSVHTFWLRTPIDVVFCDRELEVVLVVPELPPRRLHGKRGAKVTFELAPGEAARLGIAAGTRLVLT